jgi:hypothetical protein
VRRNAVLQAECRQQIMEASDGYLDRVLDRRPSQPTQVPAVQKSGQVLHIVQLSREYNVDSRPPRRGRLI